MAMWTKKYPDYGTKEYDEKQIDEKQIAVKQLECDLLAAGIAEIFATHDRYSSSELADMAYIYQNAVTELEDLQQSFDAKYATDEDNEE